MKSACVPSALGPLLGHAAHLARERMDARMSRYDMTPAQTHTLLYLCDQGGSVPQREVVEHLRVKPSTVNGILDRMEEKGLGTDMAGGYTLSLLRTITDAIQASKLRWVYTERNGEPCAKKRFMTIANAFYLATKGGGAFFGKVGSFEPGYEFDAVVLDDAPLADFVERPLPDRLQRILWCHTPETVTAKFIQGKQVYQA